SKTRILKRTLEGAGLSEAITYSLVDRARGKAFSVSDKPNIELLMPMSEAHAVLRQSLLPHLIDAVAYNVARKNTNVFLYEIGRVFFANG
ncbi:hypothetical protein NL473_28080, partial [Klebsiella pneumoniae]|nr:hypothetical protein [Klebsiella pneumoniae]MCP6594483.1 hypothetical protein [Klebsiella pneumoniae]